MFTLSSFTSVANSRSLFSHSVRGWAEDPRFDILKLKKILYESVGFLFITPNNCVILEFFALRPRAKHTINRPIYKRPVVEYYMAYPQSSPLI